MITELIKVMKGRLMKKLEEPPGDSHHSPLPYYCDAYEDPNREHLSEHPPPTSAA